MEYCFFSKEHSSAIVSLLLVRGVADNVLSSTMAETRPGVGWKHASRRPAKLVDHLSELNGPSSSSRIDKSVCREPAFVALVVFLILRFALITVTLQFPEGARLIDSGAYMSLAAELIETGSYASPNWPPGYPVFIALVSGWREPSFVSVIFAQLLVSSLTALMLVAVGRRLAGKPAGLIAGWLYALSLNASLWSLTVMTETIFAAGLVISLWLWMRAVDDWGPAAFFASGFFLGLATMFRNIGLLIFPLWVFLSFWFYLRRRSFAEGFKAGMALLLGVLVLVVPWMTRNYLVRGEFTFTEQSADTFYAFNIARVLAAVEGTSRGEAAVQISQLPDPFSFTVDLLSDHPRIFLQEQAEGILRSMFGVSTGAWARVFGFPLETQGSLNIFGSFISGKLDEAYRQATALARSPDTAILLMLTILGILHSVTMYVMSLGLLLDGQQNWMALSLVIGTVMILLLTPGAVGQARFRIPAEPFLALCAGAGWVGLRSWHLSRSSRQDALTSIES